MPVGAFVERYPRIAGSIGLLITSDEEGAADDGTLKVMETLASRGETFQYCVVGEPSSAVKLGDTVRIGRRGSLSGIMTIRGVQGHVAYPLAGRQSDPRAREVRCRDDARADRRGQRALSADDVSDGQRVKRCRRAERRAGRAQVPVQSALLERLDARHARGARRNAARRARHRLRAPLARRRQAVSHATGPADRRGTSRRSRSDGLEPELSTSGGTSDGRFIAPYGIDVVELGPINATIHKVNEVVVDRGSRAPRAHLLPHRRDLLLRRGVGTERSSRRPRKASRGPATSWRR